MNRIRSRDFETTRLWKDLAKQRVRGCRLREGRGSRGEHELGVIESEVYKEIEMNSCTMLEPLSLARLRYSMIKQ
jgi:hypothetical protein